MRVCGLPGAGKTTLLDTVGRAAGLLVISRDLIRAAMFPGPERHTPRETMLAFEAMLGAAESPLQRGGRVALDGCCFAHAWQRQRVRELARSTGAAHIGVYLDVPVAEAVRRVAAAGEHPANDRDPALVARVAGDLGAPDPQDVVIDGTLGIDQTWAILRCLLQTAAGGSQARD